MKFKKIVLGLLTVVLTTTIFVVGSNKVFAKNNQLTLSVYDKSIVIKDSDTLETEIDANTITLYLSGPENITAENYELISVTGTGQLTLSVGGKSIVIKDGDTLEP